MLLWNLESPDELFQFVGENSETLSKRLRIARMRDSKLEYVKPVRVRRGWIDPTTFVVDAVATGRSYGAHDPLRVVPGEVVILLREK